MPKKETKKVEKKETKKPEKKKEEKIKTVGIKREVFNGKAKHTSGGLKKGDLIKNKGGKIVSKKASEAAKKNKNLINAGYVTEKGKFGAKKI